MSRKIFESIRAWCHSEVKIYSHLREFAEALRRADLPRHAERIDNAFYGSTGGEILNAQRWVLRLLLKEEKLPKQLKRQTRKILFEIWGIRHRFFFIAISECDEADIVQRQVEE